MILLFTGSVGSGKTTLAKAIAKEIGAELLDINGIAKKEKLGKEAGLEFVADLKRLKLSLIKRINRLIREKKSVVVEGHLACEFALPCDKIIVLRCNPFEIEKRLEKRKYSAEKIRGNAMAEALDYCSVKVAENYPKSKIVEIDNTKPKSASAVLKILSGKAIKAKKTRWLSSYLEKRKFD